MPGFRGTDRFAGGKGTHRNGFYPLALQPEQKGQLDMTAKLLSLGSAWERREKPWASYLLWIPAAALLGFVTAALFAGVFRLPRSLYLLFYVALAGGLFYAYMGYARVYILEILDQHWVWGLIAAVVLSVFTVRNILEQPASAHSTGFQLAFDIMWAGVIYGLVDALLLSVLPVLATWKAFTVLGWTRHWWGKIIVSILALFASVLVTAVYHLGYPEYQVAGGVTGPLVGNTVMSLGYILSGNPIAAMISHMAMHIAGVLQGPATVMQLPPHY